MVFIAGAIVFFIICNSFFVASETAFVAARKSRLDMLVRKSPIPNKLMRETVDNLNFYIAATQFGTSVSGIAVGWFGQLLVGRIFGTSHNPFIDIFTFLIITFLIMIFGELVPKRIAMKNPERLSLTLLMPLLIFTRIFSPFISAINYVTEALMRLFRFSIRSGSTPYTENELRIIIEQSVKEKVVPKSLKSIIYNALRLSRISSNQIMIPANDIVGFHTLETIGQVRKKIKDNNLQFNRYPIYHNKLQRHVGFVEIADLAGAISGYDEGKTLWDCKIIRKAIQTDGNRSADEVLASMLRHQTFVAIVKNKGGDTLGIITITEIIKRLVS